MNFSIRKAVSSDISGIMYVMNQAKKGMKNSDWFVADNEAFVKEHLENKGYTIVAETEDGRIAGFFLVKRPDEEENLGKLIHFSPEQQKQVFIMDTAAVLEEYRGFGLQGKMLQEAEKYIDKKKYRYLMCTIHPDNVFSRTNMEKNGYMVTATVKCYGGLDRNILVKDLQNMNSF